jgi:hypothetical protein
MPPATPPLPPLLPEPKLPHDDALSFPSFFSLSPIFQFHETAARLSGIFRRSLQASSPNFLDSARTSEPAPLPLPLFSSPSPRVPTEHIGLSDLAAKRQSRRHPKIASARRCSNGVSAPIQEARRRFDHVSELTTFSCTLSATPSLLPITGSLPLFVSRTAPRRR